MLKKIALTLAMVAFAANAFAASNFAGTGGALYGIGTSNPPAGITFMPSKNVLLGYEPSALGGTNFIVYSIGSKNSAGDKIFGATSASSAVGTKAGAAGAALAATDGPSLPTTSSDSALDNGFTAL